MTDDQITALAREYAEWVTDVPKAKELPNCLRNEANKLIADSAERMLTWLCDRFCLVEKEAIHREYDIVKRAYDEPQNEEEKRVAEFLLGLIYCLFPEIAKEVEK